MYVQPFSTIVGKIVGESFAELEREQEVARGRAFYAEPQAPLRLEGSLAMAAGMVICSQPARRRSIFSEHAARTLLRPRTQGPGPCLVPVRPRRADVSAGVGESGGGVHDGRHSPAKPITIGPGWRASQKIFQAAPGPGHWQGPRPAHRAWCRRRWAYWPGVCDRARPPAGGCGPGLRREREPTHCMAAASYSPLPRLQGP